MTKTTKKGSKSASVAPHNCPHCTCVVLTKRRRESLERKLPEKKQELAKARAVLKDMREQEKLAARRLQEARKNPQSFADLVEDFDMVDSFQVKSLKYYLSSPGRVKKLRETFGDGVVDAALRLLADCMKMQDLLDKNEDVIVSLEKSTSGVFTRLEEEESEASSEACKADDEMSGLEDEVEEIERLLNQK